jgi:hypothetical protein
VPTTTLLHALMRRHACVYGAFPQGAKHREHGTIACVVRPDGKACKNVKWSGTQAVCVDHDVCKSRKIEVVKGVALCKK